MTTSATVIKNQMRGLIHPGFAAHKAKTGMLFPSLHLIER
jgi:hypothetical protein